MTDFISKITVKVMGSNMITISNMMSTMAIPVEALTSEQWRCVALSLEDYDICADGCRFVLSDTTLRIVVGCVPHASSVSTMTVTDQFRADLTKLLDGLNWTS